MFKFVDFSYRSLGKNSNVNISNTPIPCRYILCVLPKEKRKNHKNVILSNRKYITIWLNRKKKNKFLDGFLKLIKGKHQMCDSIINSIKIKPWSILINWLNFFFFFYFSTSKPYGVPFIWVYVCVFVGQQKKNIYTYIYKNRFKFSFIIKYNTITICM